MEYARTNFQTCSDKLVHTAPCTNVRHTHSNLNTHTHMHTKHKHAYTGEGAQTSKTIPFVAAPKFAGARAGYCFRKGEHGVGYYVDKPPQVVNTTFGSCAFNTSSLSAQPQPASVILICCRFQKPPCCSKLYVTRALSFP